MNVIIKLLSATLIVLVTAAGCSSTHDLKRDGFNSLGGGFADQEIRPGLYQLTAIGNMAPWPSFSAAIGTWRGRADKLCGKGAYQEIVEGQDVGFRGYTPTYVQPGLMLDLPKYNTSIRGYILCDSSGMTHSDAVVYLNELVKAKSAELAAAQNNELEELGGRDCNNSNPQSSAENLFRRGKLLLSNSEYSSALQCFIAAQEMGGDTSVYRDTCSSIGTMYELGWGVEKDMQTAMSWYKKAGM